MGIKKVHGFLIEKQSSKPEWGNMTINEIVLVETDSPSEDHISMLSNLPSGNPGTSSDNPLGIGFTFDISTHPKSSVLTLRSASEIRQSEQGACFWEIPLSYSIFSAQELQTTSGGGSTGSNKNPKLRKDQRAEKNPLDRPTVWNRSTNLVQKETYLKADGDPIVHTNLLPITTPFKYTQAHTIHTFSYNKAFDDYEDDFYRLYEGRINSGTAFGESAGKVRCNSITANEEYESIAVGGGLDKTEVHYIRVTVVFEINPNGWDKDAKLVSMSTLQLKPGSLLPFPQPPYYDRILVNETQYAESDWPLLPTGVAVPYDNNDPTTYGYVDHGYPQERSFTALIDDGNMVIPN